MDPKNPVAYYPPSEPRGGWRKNVDPDFVHSTGLNPDRIDDLLEYGISVPSSKWPSPHHQHVSCLVIQNGWIVGERYSRPDAADFRQYISSNGKAFAMTLLGILVQESEVDLDAKLYDSRWLPEGLPLSDPRKEKITFHQILKHTSGICPESEHEAGRDEWTDYAAWITGHDDAWPQTASLYFDPDAGQGYSSVGFGHLSLVFRNLTGQKAGEYLWQRLLQPIGFSDIGFFRPPSGKGIQSITLDDPRAGDLDILWFSAGALEMTPRDYARFAYFLMHNGNWNGNPIVPASWIQQFKTAPDYPNIRSNVDGYFDRECEGKYPPDLVRIYGSGINAGYIVPSQDLILIRTGRGDNAHSKEVNTHLLQKLFGAVL